MTPIKNAAGYIRCSTDMQAETSPEQQRSLILEWAADHGYEMVEWFVDIGKSGTSFEKRPEFARLKLRIESKPGFQAVIVLDESRWGRAGASDSIYYKTHFKKTANVDVLMVRTIANTGNATFDTMLNAFEGGLSHEESKKKSERTLDGCESAVRLGHSGGGTAPYGYQRVAVNRFSGERRTLDIVRDRTGTPLLNERGLSISEQIRPKEEYVVWEPGDPEEIEVVRRIFDLRVRRKYGYVKIAKLLNNEAVQCPRRGRWRSKDQKWSSGTVGSIIKNPTYMGARVYNRLKKRGIGKFAPRYWVRDSSNWIVIEDSHPAIVAPAQWKAANPSPKDSENGRKSRTRFDSPYLLSGLIRCSNCGFNFTGKAQTVGTPGSRRKRRTYADSGYTSKGPSVCSSMSIDAEKLEANLLNLIRDRVGQPGISARLQQLIDHYLAGKAAAPRGIAERIQTSVLKVQNQISSLLALAERGINLDEIADRIKELEREKVTLERRLNQHASAQTGRKEIKQVTHNAAQFLTGFEEEFSKAPAHERKTMVRQLVDGIVIDRERRIAKCSILKAPKMAGKIVQEMLENDRTHLMSVPPTRFELVLQA